ncbi:hypothetical protein AB0J86_35955, partial [Micromonospora sp. NPDC049559]
MPADRLDGQLLGHPYRFGPGDVRGKLRGLPRDATGGGGGLRPSQGWGTREQIMNVEYATTKFLDAA